MWSQEKILFLRRLLLAVPEFIYRNSIRRNQIPLIHETNRPVGNCSFNPLYRDAVWNIRGIEILIFDGRISLFVSFKNCCAGCFQFSSKSESDNIYFDYNIDMTNMCCPLLLTGAIEIKNTNIARHYYNLQCHNCHVYGGMLVNFLLKANMLPTEFEL